jgi:hypothetical protein
MADRKKLLPTGGQYGGATDIFSDFYFALSSSPVLTFGFGLLLLS